jgi:hypothetical protein
MNAKEACLGIISALTVVGKEKKKTLEGIGSSSYIQPTCHENLFKDSEVS